MSAVNDVFIWENGMVMTFDREGKQIPEFQGKMDEVIPKLLEAGVKLSEVLRSRSTYFPEGR